MNFKHFKVLGGHLKHLVYIVNNCLCKELRQKWFVDHVFLTNDCHSMLTFNVKIFINTGF